MPHPEVTVTPPPHVTNERYRALSRTLFQLGGALLGATAVRLYQNLALDWALVVWSVGAASLIWVGWLILGLLESEK